MSGVQLLRTSEVAARLRVNVRTVQRQRLIAAGRLAFTDVSVSGRARVRVSERQLDEFIASRELPPSRPRGYR